MNGRSSFLNSLVAFYTSGGIAMETGEYSRVLAWRTAQLTLATQSELRNNDIIFIAENPVTRGGRTISHIKPSLITTPVNAAMN